MKKENLLIVIGSSLLCSLMFYDQNWGMNIPLFAIMVVTAQFLSNKTLKHNIPWLTSAFLAILTSLGYYFTNNTSAGILFVLSLMFTAGLQHQHLLLISLPFHVIIDYFRAPFIFIIDLFRIEKKQGEETKGAFSMRLIIVPVIIIGLFLIFYTSANSILSNQVQYLFSKVNFSYFLFLVFSFTLTIPLLRSQNIKLFVWIENSIKKMIGLISESPKTENERKTDNLIVEAYIVFSGLIMLLSYLVILDLTTAFDQTTISETLHKSTNTLIGSMFMAIIVILYYFSLPVVHHSKFKGIKIIISIWILLNIVMCAVCFNKTTIYIYGCGLTYKRIGVYTYLFITVLSLAITLYKTNKQLDNWSFIKNNLWMIYIVLSIYAAAPWDIIITHYNLKHDVKRDINYIRYLSNSATIEYYKIKKENNDFDVSELKNQMEYTVNLLKNKSLLSLTAEDLRIISVYDQLTSQQ